MSHKHVPYKDGLADSISAPASQSPVANLLIGASGDFFLYLEETMPELIWSNGDKWRSLTADITAAGGTITVLTENGTIRLINIDNGWQKRIPGPSREMRKDNITFDLSSFDATPCGMRTNSMDGSWHLTTPMLAVIKGEQVEFAQEIFVMMGKNNKVHYAPGHPSERCACALYCQVWKEVDTTSETKTWSVRDESQAPTSSTERNDGE